MVRVRFRGGRLVQESTALDEIRTERSLCEVDVAGIELESSDGRLGDGHECVADDHALVLFARRSLVSTLISYVRGTQRAASSPNSPLVRWPQ
jgi:hypothetical protein